MKLLLILRHAKSGPAAPGLGDHARVLDDAGRREAARVGDWLRRVGLRPELMLCSSAVRAQATAELVVEHGGFDGELRTADDLYLAGGPCCIRILRANADDLDRVMLVGHNPGVEELLRLLTGQRATMTTAALASVRLPVDRWSELESSPRCDLEGFWRPEDLPGEPD